jgi:hypothetical protein
MSNRPISFRDFKNWLCTQQDLSEFFNIGMDPDDPNDKYIGKQVRTKVSEQKMLERVETEDEAETIIQDFAENGGIILAVDGKRVLIEVDSGSFYLPRFCVKLVKEQSPPAP